jgi:hypothetical protein
MAPLKEDTGQMLSRSFGRVVAVWHGKGEPAANEWSVFLEQIRAMDMGSGRGLVLTEGGAPTSAQRLELFKAVGLRPVPVAVVSDHVGVRFIASSVALVMRRVRGFTSRELGDALRYLELTPDEILEAKRFVAECAGRPS